LAGHKEEHRQADVQCVISGFRREVDENSTLQGYYAASGGNVLPTFRVRNCTYALHDIPEECSSQGDVQSKRRSPLPSGRRH
jgi:hypothetical protein